MCEPLNTKGNCEINHKQSISRNPPAIKIYTLKVKFQIDTVVLNQHIPKPYRTFCPGQT